MDVELEVFTYGKFSSEEIGNLDLHFERGKGWSNGIGSMVVIKQATGGSIIGQEELEPELMMVKDQG